MNELLLELEFIQHSNSENGKNLLTDEQRAELIWGDDPVFISHL